MSNTLHDEWYVMQHQSHLRFNKNQKNTVQVTERTLKMILKDKVKPCLFCGNLLNHVADRGSGIQERNTCDYRHNGRNYLFTRKLETLQGMIGPERQQTQMQFDSKKIKKKVYVFRMERLAHLEYFIQICYWKMISRYPTTLLNDELKTHFRGKLF